jgi:hypothetical protein
VPDIAGTQFINRFIMTPREVIDIGNSLDPAKESMANDLWAYMSGIVAGKQAAKKRTWFKRSRA